MRRPKFLAGLLAGVLMATQLYTMPVQAESHKVVTLGANLSEEQKASILQFFGVSESDVEIITITNEDEREQLQFLIPLEKIGSKTFSCALVDPTTSGGINVKTANMNYVTSNMIASTLCTSGVVNCDVLTASPFEVSGTGALTGVMMAYESASGILLDEDKKELANEELVTTNDIAETMGQDEATLVVNDIKINIIRDEVTDDQQVVAVVDAVIDMAETKSAELAEAKGEKAPARLNQDDHNKLYEFGSKVAKTGYKYDDVKVTLQRVAVNVTESTGIDDPILDTFEDLYDNNLSASSILMNTDDDALGDEASINATNQGAMGVDPGNRSMGSNDVSLSLYNTMDSGNYIYPIYGGNQLRARNNDGYTLIDIDGNALSGTSFANLESEYQYIIASVYNNSVNNEGVLTQTGMEIVPCKYGKVRFENLHWMTAYTYKAADANNYDASDYDNNYYLIDTVDIYYFDGDTARLAGTFTREHYEDAYAVGRYINIQDRSNSSVTCYDSNFTAVQSGVNSLYTEIDVVKQDAELHTISYNGQTGLVDRDGNVVMEASFRYINLNLDYNYFVVSTGDKDGLIDREGNILVPAEYDKIYSCYNVPKNPYTNRTSDYVANGYVAFETDGKLGYCDVNGNVTCEATMSAERLDNEGASSIYEDLSGEQYILAADGVNTSVSGYENVYALQYTSGMLYRVSDSNYNYGVIDWHGNVILPCEYDDIDVTADGNYLIANYDYDSYQIYKISMNGPKYAKTTVPETESPSETPAPQTEAAPAQVETPQTEAAPAQVETPQTEAAPAQVQTPQTETASGTAQTDPVKQLIDTAEKLLNENYEVNKITAGVLLGQAAVQISGTNVDAYNVLNSASILLNSPDTTQESVMVLLTTAKIQLGY